MQSDLLKTCNAIFFMHTPSYKKISVEADCGSGLNLAAVQDALSDACNQGWKVRGGAPRDVHIFPRGEEFIFFQGGTTGFYRQNAHLNNVMHNFKWGALREEAHMFP